MMAKLPYILSALLMISCGSGNRNAAQSEAISEPVEETDFFVFDLEKGISEGPRASTLNGLIDTIRYIPLETHKDALLPNYCRLVKVDGDMFLFGGGFMFGQPESPVYQFDSLGRFVKQMISIGRGPNEVSMPQYLYSNANLRQINVVDLASKMIIASTESGEKSTVQITTSMRNGMVPLNDSTFVSAQATNRKDTPKTYLYFTDRNSNVVHALERNDELASYNSETSEYVWALPYETYWLDSDYKGDAIFHDIFNDTIYRVKSHREITPHLVFKRGALSPRPEDTHKAENKRKQVYFNGLIESGDHVFVSYYHDGKIWRDVWSKSDGSQLLHAVSGKFGTVADIFLPFTLPSEEVVDLQVVYADHENIYCVMEALDACKFLPGVKEDDNPVIVVATLKK